MEEITELIRRSQAGDKEAREVLIEENLGLVHHVVKRFAGRGCEMEDLFQIGSIGLMKAIDKFDLSFDVRFSTYAVPMIMGEIKRFLRDDGMLKVSRTLKENGMRIKLVIEKLTKELGRDPALFEVAEAAELTPEEVTMALEAGVQVESLYQSVYQADGSEIYLVDKVVKEAETGTGTTYMDPSDREKDKVLDVILLKHLMEQLDGMEKEIIRLRFFEDKTQTQVAKLLDMSQVQICRQEKKILLKLRKLALKER